LKRSFACGSFGHRDGYSQNIDASIDHRKPGSDCCRSACRRRCISPALARQVVNVRHARAPERHACVRHRAAHWSRGHRRQVGCASRPSPLHLAELL